MGVTSAVTLAGIRDADPGVVAALVERRGPSVFAYCELVAAPGSASIAAADALARFRLAVIAVEHLNKSEAESRLRTATRDAATRRGTRAVAGRDADAGTDACAKTEGDLLQHLLDKRPTPDRDALSEHIADCQGCQETLERLEAAELAFARPATTTLPAGVGEQIVTAFVIAAPVRVEGENVASVRRKALRLLAGQPADTTESPAVAPADAGEPLSPEAIAALSAYAATPDDESDLSFASTGAASGRPPGPKDDDFGPWDDAAAGAAGGGVVAALDGPGAGAAASGGSSLRERIESRAAQRSAGTRGRRRRIALAGVFAVFVVGAGTALAMNLTSSDEPETTANAPLVDDSTTGLDTSIPTLTTPPPTTTTVDPAAQKAAREREQRERRAKAARRLAIDRRVGRRRARAKRERLARIAAARNAQRAQAAPARVVTARRPPPPPPPPARVVAPRPPPPPPPPPPPTTPGGAFTDVGEG